MNNKQQIDLVELQLSLIKNFRIICLRSYGSRELKAIQAIINEKEQELKVLKQTEKFLKTGNLLSSHKN